MQAFVIDDSGNPQLVGTTHGIDNMDREHGGSGEGQGYLKVLAADGIATVVYANDDSLNDHVCGSSGQFIPSDIAWGAVSTFDGGNSWNDHSHAFETHNFVWCAFGGLVQRGLKEFDAAIGPDGSLFVIVTAAEGEARLFMSPTRGVENHNAHAWREWCPGTPSIVGGPLGQWTAPGGACPTAAFSDGTIIHPTLGFDTNGRLIVSFYEPNGPNLELFAQAVTAPRGAVVGLSDLQAETPPDGPFSVAGAVAIGYLPYSPTAPAIDAQSANVLGWQMAVVAEGPMQPFPQGTAKLFAFWTQVDQSPFVESARLDFTPTP